jgi:hypothetical protein
MPRDTSLTGDVSRAQIMAALALQGKAVLVPLTEGRRYDLVIEEEGKFFRVQCKTGRLIRGAVRFYSSSVDSRSQPGRCIRKGYVGEVEFFGVYCPDNDKCYLVPVDGVPQQGCSLRVDPPKNGQKTNIRWAGDYEIKGR